MVKFGPEGFAAMARIAQEEREKERRQFTLRSPRLSCLDNRCVKCLS
jgi:hypothetical protein